MSNIAITKTEITGINAETLLQRFELLKADIAELKKQVFPKEDTQLLTRDEVAKMLGISLPTLHAWSKSGLLIRYRIANKVRYKKHEVLEALTKINNKPQ